MRNILVLIHAGAGVAGLVAGLGVIAPPLSLEHRRWLRRLYFFCLTVLSLGLITLISNDWNGLVWGARIPFAGLGVMSVVMVYVATSAALLIDPDETGWEDSYITRIYFTYVSLWVGLAIVPALRSSSPLLWTPVAVLGVVALGNVMIGVYKKRRFTPVPHKRLDV